MMGSFARKESGAAERSHQPDEELGIGDWGLGEDEDRPGARQLAFPQRPMPHAPRPKQVEVSEEWRHSFAKGDSFANRDIGFANRE